MLDFEDVTILYGGNGCGKTTALNVIAEKLGLLRDSLYNRSNFFEDYTSLCSFETKEPIPGGSRLITSDDVFDFMLNLRTMNEGINQKREDSARFFGCQFIICTHSPFLLSMRNAKIYDLDEEMVDVKRWIELKNVRTYYEFFKQHENEFEEI